MNENLYNAITWFYNKTCEHDINWITIGSLGLVLQGISLIPNDIDILTDKMGFHNIEALFKNHIRKTFDYSPLKKSRSLFGTLEYNDITIEIIAELENKFNGHWESHKGLSHKKYIQVKDMVIPILSLSYEQYICQQLNRKKKAIQIQNFL